jgi:hypothetical protein
VRIVHPLALLACAIAWLLIVFVEVESVLFTGPVILTLGVLLIIGGALARDARAVAFGIAHAFICVLFFLLVNLFGWSPGQAKQPFTVMGASYTCVAVALAVVAPVRTSAESAGGRWRW